MKNYFENTTAIIEKYNEIINKIQTFTEETTDEEDEILQNYCIYLAHALIKDYGYDQRFRDELSKVADIINDVLL